MTNESSSPGTDQRMTKGLKGSALTAFASLFMLKLLHFRFYYRNARSLRLCDPLRVDHKLHALFERAAELWNL